MKTNNSRFDTKRLVVLSLFAALAYVTVFVLRISGIGGFLTFDVKDTIITIAAMIFGPLAGAGISLVVSLLEMITVSGTGFWGFIMNFVSSAVFAVCASTIYMYMPKIKRTVAGAVIGLGVSVVAMTSVMLVMNLIITPIYYSMPVENVKAMLVPLLLPFNLIKSVLNSALVMMLYKPVSTMLRRFGIGRTEKQSDGEVAVKGYHLRGKSLVVLICGAVIAVLCVVLLIFVFGGKWELF